MTQRPGFVFVTCQVGAERAVKYELAKRWAGSRFAYSRPGFLTFKLPADHKLLADFDIDSVFSRAYGFSVGKVNGHSVQDRATAVWDIYGQRPFRRVHVWERDRTTPGDHGFEPGITHKAEEAREAICENCPRPEEFADGVDDLSRPAGKGEFVLDCIIVEPNEWWVGYHRVKTVPSQWPGGMIPVTMPPDAVSRAWLKTEEALAWSQLPLAKGSRCAELGSAPGGSTQALLSRGMIVMGIDPAEMRSTVLAHPNFTHIRRRAKEVRRRELRKVRWLLSDMNVAPSYTMEAIQSIVTHRDVSIRGILATLKLTEWHLAEQVDDYLARVRTWGFNIVRARQLRHNRQEVCFAAVQKPFIRKPYRQP